MAGARAGIFKELISPFLQAKLQELHKDFGPMSPEYNAIARQYVKSDLETRALNNKRQRRRHYEAEVEVYYEGEKLQGVERLYRRTVLLAPTLACAAHCRWCLRGQYDIHALTSQQVLRNLEYFASLGEVNEILITGGEPLIALPQLEFILDNIEKLVPQIQIVRIGARLLTQAPDRLTDHTLSLLSRKRRYRIEVGVHICHPIEFWPETIAKIRLLRDAGIRLYNQHPLLKEVNDNEGTLINLYDLMRQHDIEAHYIFHCIPMQGMDHHRTGVERDLNLVSSLTAGGHFSGRAKPIYTAMTDIGKISLFHGSIVRRDEVENMILLRSSYRYEDRKAWNPSWENPQSCEIDDQGYMAVWYPDGEG
jgi:lysine 2,3-aminomutase